MTKPKFTPGPWTALIQGKDSEYIDVIDKNGRFICGCFENIPREEEPIANAALIAAAPDMYEALEEILSDLYTFPQVAPGVDHPEVFDLKLKLRKLLRKARGESEVNHG